MRSFVAYHNAEKMGYDYEPGSDYSFFSRRALAFLEKTIGESIWVISGVRSDGRTAYTLCAVYTPDQVFIGEEASSEYIVSGSIGHDFDPPIELNGMPWFQGFLKSQANFSLGINEIKDKLAIEYLTELASNSDVFILFANESTSLPEDIDRLDMGAAEGQEVYLSHLRRERNRTIIDAKKERVLDEHGRLTCEVCGFDFAAIYGKLGEGYCEVHHKIPLASLAGARVTTLSDLAIVCSNCHRVLHRNTPMPSVSELKEHFDGGPT